MWQIGPVLELRDEHWDAICAHGLRAYPLEACGLLIGEWQGDRVIRFEPTPNAARSSRIYEAYPSPTDIAAAPDPQWHYPIVSLRGPQPVMRSFGIVDGQVVEEPVTVVDSA